MLFEKRFPPILFAQGRNEGKGNTQILPDRQEWRPSCKWLKSKYGGVMTERSDSSKSSCSIFIYACLPDTTPVLGHPRYERGFSSIICLSVWRKHEQTYQILFWARCVRTIGVSIFFLSVSHSHTFPTLMCSSMNDRRNLYPVFSSLTCRCHEPMSTVEGRWPTDSSIAPHRH